MGLAKRVIPVLLMQNNMLVKGKQYKPSRVVGDIHQAAEIYQLRGVDEMVVIDVGATMYNKPPPVETVRELTEKCFMPITAGGGVQTLTDVRHLLANGADKVLIGTAAYKNDDLVRKAANSFGRQAVVVAVDAIYEGSNWFATIKCGTEILCYSPVAYAQELEYEGAGELIVSAVTHDGMLDGYALDLIRSVANAVNIPVIANCGAGCYDHMHDALTAGASAVAASAMFQWTDCTPHGAAEYLKSKGWETRI